MLINKNDKFSIRKFKNGRSDSVKIGAIGVIVGTAIALSAGSNSAEAAMKENSDNTTTISNDKGSVIVDTANIENPNEGRQFSTDPTAEGTNTITKTGKVDYKYVTAEGNTVLEENKNQNSGADKTIETTYNVYGKSGEVFKETTGGDAQDSDLNDAKENGKKATIEKDGKTYHLIGEPKVETTGNGGGVYSDTTLGDVTAKLTPEGLSNAEGKITYDTVKAGGKAWIVEQTGKGTYGKYVQADSGAITSDAKMVEAFKAGEAAAKDFTSANVTADGGIKEGDYVFVLEKNTYVTANTESQALTGSIPLSSSDNVADDVDGTGATLNRTYTMVQNFKAAPDTLTGVENKTLVKGYLAYLQGKGLEDNLLNFKRYVSIGLAGIAEDQVDAKGRPTRDLTADTSSVSNSDTLELENGGFLLRLNAPSLDVEEYSYRDEITPLRAYRVASGTTTITYTYAEEKTREIEKKGSVVVNYQTTDGVELKSPYTDTPETVAEVVTEHYYVNADGQEVVVEDKTVKTPKNVAYNTKENETEKPQKLTDAQGNVYYLNEANTKTAVNDTETTSPAETGTVVEGVTKVTYIYEKAGSVIVNYKTEDGTPLAGTVVDEDGAGKTVESGAKDTDNGKPGTAYNTADNGMKPTRIKTAEGKVYELVPDLTEGEEEGEVESGTTKEVTYVYKEVKGNVVVKYEDTEGNTLADDEKDETDASLNVKYDTADHKKESITKDGVKYYLTAKELKDGSKPATGDVVEGTTTVTYVYEKAGSVVVHYTDQEGNPISGTDPEGNNVPETNNDTTDGRPGSDYNTADNGMKPNRIKTAEGKVYELVPASTIGNETGKVVAGDTVEVTYVYKEVKGNVVVKYEDTEGNVIAEDEKDETDASLNVKYDTTDHKKDEITKDGVKYYLTAKALKDGSKETGDVVEGTTTVTYVYEKAGQVVVNYQTEDGTPLVGVDPAGANVASGAKDTVDGKPGSDYDTSDNGMKPARITTAEGKVYELVPTATKGDETGTVVAGETKEVTYVYKEVTGDVVVHYVDTEGNTIAADKDDLKGASLSEKYDTAVDNKPEKITAEDGTVYYITKAGLKDDSKPETGNVVEGKTDVTYVYEKAGSVIVNYQTEDGTPLVGTADGKDIASGAKDTDNGKPGSEYNTADNGMKPTRITTAEGKVYELVPASTKGDETGTVESGQTKEVTYVYKEVKGNVVVKYEDTEGNVLAEDEKDETDASLNAKYDTADHKKDEITKDGVKYYLTAKELKDDSKPATGDVVEGTTTVTYVYEKAGQVVVNYQTEDGTPLVGVDPDGANVASGAKDTVDGKPGSDYNTADNNMKPARITTAEGKVYELVPTATKGDETGKVVAGETKEVTYVYKEVTGDVVVHYVDTEGNVIAEDKEDTKGASLNAKYDTTDNKPEKIEKDGTVYYLTAKELKEGSKPENGAVVEGTTEISYVYEKAGQVVVHYVDEAGNTLQADAVDTKDGKPGSKYDTTDNDMKPTRITTPEGKVYKLVPASTKGNETGDVEAGKTTEVTYVYEVVKGDVTVTYKDTENKVIEGYETPKDAEKDAPTGKDFNTATEALKPTKITTPSGKVYNLVPERTEGKETGKVTETPQNVTYVYELAKGNVTVTYKDTEGNTIEGYETPKDAEKDQPTGKEFNTATEALKPSKITTPSGKVYNLVPTRTEGNEKGKVTEEPQNVTYVYELAKGNVTVTYKDTEGNKIEGYETPKDAEKDAPTGKDFNTATEALKPAKITTPSGKVYNLVPARTEGTESGKVTETPQNVTYVYELAKGDVTVTYKDTEGNKIPGYETPKTVETQSPTGKEYTTVTEALKPSKITTPDGKVYNLVPTRTEGNENGKVTENPQNVTYVYELAKGNVTVKYENEAGETIKPDNNLKSQVPTGDEYNTTTVKDLTITKDGKLYKLVEKNGGVKEGSSVENGKVTETPAVVTYVYSEVKGEIIQKFVNESGKEIKDPTNTGKKSLNEKVNLEHPNRITDKDGKVYEFVKVDKIPTNFTEQPQTATYTYRAVKGQGVTVSYETTTGVTLKETQTVQPKDTQLGTEYDTTTSNFKPERIEKDGKVYILTAKTKPGSAEEKGKVTEQPQNVTYVYEEVKEPETPKPTPETPKPTPETPNTDESKSTIWKSVDGETLKPRENGTKDKTSIPGYEFVRTEKDKEGNTVHIYRKVTSSTPEVKEKETLYVDENGKEIRSTKKGKQPKENIPGYEFVRTVVDENGNIRHIFRKVTVATPKAQIKRLANTGTTETNTGLAGLGLALFGGLLAASKRRKNK